MSDLRPAVLQVLPALNAGGVERGTLEIAEALAQAGFRPFVASAGGRMVAELEARGGRHVTLPLDRKSPGALLGQAGALAQLIRAEGIGIVHARSRFPAWATLMAARRAGAHFVTTYHGAYNEGFPGKRLYNSVMARGERVIAISQFIAGLIRERHGTDARRIRVIPRGVDVARFDPDAVPEARVHALRAAWGVPEGRPVLLLPGRITRWKGQGVLLQALASLPAPRPFALLVGDEGRGGYAAELRQQIAALGLEGDAAMPGHCDDLPAAFLLADLALHCSTDAEAFGRTIVEAQAMCRPVIASDLGAPRETVLEGETGWRTPPGDAAALAGAIARALAMPAEERARIGAQGRAMVLEHYTTAAMQRATLSVYRELL
ncbi:glycosyltransferase family 4 protein [Roseomonas marmotae]|uniref:Glycosyltransferase family 4 protein n=1 Tax=Roseomonas marmotae TaxID=2768161 RepID=A0ABS3K6X5_9PROT|nr:glycosyltransferase family 4 protein [Roseomonas marmotae]MBO1073201.1 glycosyltransferase family 4 protein [Roseomonas marmotae]QTI79169.1 glycosyltransferase family 4 protein [Roseomonas marmotae]